MQGNKNRDSSDSASSDELDDVQVTTNVSCVPPRIILLYIIGALHAAAALCMIADVSHSSSLFRDGDKKMSSFDASLISFDFIVMAALFLWSILQVLVAFKLSSGIALKATVLCWTVFLVEAILVVVFIYGLFGNTDAPHGAFESAGSIILTCLVSLQFAYTVIVTSFVGTKFQRFGCGPKCICCPSDRGYQSLV